MKKKISILIGFFMVVIIVFYSQSFRQVENKPEVSTTKTLHYGFVLTNETNRAVRNAKFYTRAPSKRTPFQRCTQIETSPPCKILLDSYGNQILQFQFTQFPPYGSKTIAISAVVEMVDDASVTGSRDTDIWLISEKWVESEDPLIVRKMKGLKKDDRQSTVRAIFNFVSGHISYSGYLRNERGARYALVHRKGDCTEYADLFTALCRAAGIPAQRVGGYICHQTNNRLTGNGYHNWSQVLMDRKWYLSDPQNRIFNAKQSDYIVMKIIGAHKDRSIPEFHRFKVIGDGIAVKMAS